MNNFFSRLLNISFIAYSLLPAGSIILTLASFVGCRLRYPIKVSVAYLIFCAYIGSIWLISVITINDRSVFNTVASSKVLFFLALAFLISQLSMRELDWRKVFERFRKLFYFASFILMLGTYFGGTQFWGMRGDIGLLVAISTSLVASYHLTQRGLLSAVRALLCFTLGLGHLVLLEGRTALVVVIFTTLYCLRIFGKHGGYNANRLTSFLLGFVLIIFAALMFVSIFEARGGLEYVQNEEARLLAFMYWLEVMKETDLTRLFLGHGLGSCADKIVSSFPIASSHIEQIKRSSGICYVSWGFHNTILALIYEYGVIVIFFCFYLLLSIWRNLKIAVKPYFFLYILFIAIASPNNHLVNNDLIGTLVFCFLGVFLNKELSRKWPA